MKLHMLQDLKSRRPLPQISFKSNPVIGKKSEDKKKFLMAEINVHIEEINSNISA